MPIDAAGGPSCFIPCAIWSRRSCALTSGCTPLSGGLSASPTACSPSVTCSWSGGRASSQLSRRRSSCSSCPSEISAGSCLVGRAGRPGRVGARARCGRAPGWRATVGLRTRLPRMAAYQEQAATLAEAVRGLAGVEVIPDPPHTPMMHLLFHREAGAVRAAALRIAGEDRVWTFAQLAGTDVPGVCRAELEVGDATLGWTPAAFRDLMQRLLTD